DNGPELMEEIYGDEVAWVDWMRPGFELGLKLQETIEQNPSIKGIILGGHGLMNWADDDRECYELSIELINKASDYLADHELGTDTVGDATFDAVDRDYGRENLAEVVPDLRGRVGQG